MESLQLRVRASELASEGDVLSAMILDEYARLLDQGHSWEQLLDDVDVRAPYLN